MSKNIEEIVESVLPKRRPLRTSKRKYFDMDSGFNQGVSFCSIALTQAITEKKLVVPVSEEAIEKIIGDIHYDLLGTGTPNGKFHSKCAKAIYERQFKGDE